MKEAVIYLLIGTVACRSLGIKGLLEVLIWPFTLAIVVIARLLDWKEEHDEHDR